MTAGEWVTLSAYLVGFGVFLWQSHASGFDREAMVRLGAIGLLCGALGARLAQNVFGGGSFSTMLSTQAGGRTILAGVLCGWMGVEVTKRAMGLKRSTGAAFALALSLGEAIGRVGCHLNGCCYGREWQGPLAVVQHGVERFPAQLASSLYALLVFGVLFALRSRWDGATVFSVFVALFASGRFGLEFLRESPSVLWGMSLAQWVCLEVLLGAVAVLVWKWARRRQAA